MNIVNNIGRFSNPCMVQKLQWLQSYLTCAMTQQQNIHKKKIWNSWKVWYITTVVNFRTMRSSKIIATLCQLSDYIRTFRWYFNILNKNYWRSCAHCKKEKAAAQWNLEGTWGAPHNRIFTWEIAIWGKFIRSFKFLV